jgi:O-acetyl-ADP-ribose deacetylase (regulator of RNase III)
VNNDCFVIMPYGKKKGVGAARAIDFDKVYEEMIVPAIDGFLGLRCVRCDRIDEPGSIHKRMLTQIFEARVAVVDTSTLNANVFYELGVRHALKRSVTVLIQEKGTVSPFNIAGMATILYAATKQGMVETQDTIRNFVKNALANPNGTDSLVYEALPHLRVQRSQQPITKVSTTHYRLASFPETGPDRRRIGYVTGDRADIKVGAIWVNSENTNMQMDTFYGKSTSATIRYFGAEKDNVGAVVRDTIGEALRAQVQGRVAVDPATVIPTTAGALEETNQVKWIFHVASVMGQPLLGYRPIDQIERCVKAAIRHANSPKFASDAVRSILFPIFGTGPGGGDLEATIKLCIDAAVEQLELGREPALGLRDVYFYVWGEADLDICKMVALKNPALVADDPRSV